MEFSGQFDTHFFETIRSFTQDMFTIYGVLYVQTDQKVTKRGIYPSEIIMIQNQRGVQELENRSMTNERIVAIYWERGEKIF